jgi:CHASE2 domain
LAISGMQPTSRLMRLPRGLGRWCARAGRNYLQHLKHHWRHHLVVTLLVACLVKLSAEFWVGLEDRALQLGQVLALATPPSGLPFLAGVAIVKIDPLRYADPNAYAGKSPLDRCQLTRDLGRLLQVPGVKTVAVDFDLSPSERAADASLENAKDLDRNDRLGKPETLEQIQVEQECQKRLDSLLVDPKHVRRLILMLPSASAHAGTETLIANWTERMRTAGVQLGSVDLNLTRGVLRTYRPEPTPGQVTFSEAIRASLQSAASDGKSVAATNAAEPIGETSISYAPLRQVFKSKSTQLRELNLDDPCLLPRVEGCGLHTIVFGAGYSRDDEFLTPVGYLNGVDVHVALAACAANTVSQAKHHKRMELASEVLVCVLLVAPLTSFFWFRYFRTRWSSAPKRRGAAANASGNSQHSRPARRWTMRRLVHALIPGQPAAAYGWLVYMGLALLALVSFMPPLLALISSDCAVWTLPSALVLGVMVDAAMVQGVLVAAERGSRFHEHHHRARLPFCYAVLFKPGPARLPGFARYLAYDLVLILALWPLFKPH